MNWIKRHPFQAVSFTAFNVFIATMAGFRPDLWVPFLVAFGIGLIVWICLFQIYKPLLAFLLAMLLALPGPQVKAEGHKKGGEVVIGVIIICGMTFCVYKLARFCQQHFPPPNTNQVNNLNFGPGGAGAGTNFGASFALSADPCISEGGGASTNFVLIPPTSFYINAMVSGGELRTSVNTSGDSSSMEAFIAGVQAEGLQAEAESFSLNGAPAPSSAVPISFQPTTGTVSNGVAGTAFLITVSCSRDMQTWQTVLSTTAGEGTAFQIVDTVVSQSMFYRLELR